MTEFTRPSAEEIERDEAKIRERASVPELELDPKFVGRKNAVGILDHFKRFAKGEENATFRPSYFFRTDPVETMPALYALISDKEASFDNLPHATEPTIIHEINGVVLAFQTRLDESNVPLDDFLWAQSGAEPLINPYLREATTVASQELV